MSIFVTNYLEEGWLSAGSWHRSLATHSQLLLLLLLLCLLVLILILVLLLCELFLLFLLSQTTVPKPQITLGDTKHVMASR